MFDMRFLLLLLPNLYDIFTVLMIVYAFVLNSNSQLKIPFGLACLFIYLTTRVGIFAGEIVHMIIGKSNPEEDGMEEPADVVAKRMILGVGPQCLFIIICQVILALCFLQGPASAKMASPEKAVPQEQVQVQDDTQAQAEDEAQVAEENAVKPAVSANDEAAEEEEIIPQDKKSVDKPVRRTGFTRKSAPAAKKSQAKSNEQVVADTKNSVYYDIPDRTLQTAGISPAERRINSQSAGVQNANANWSFSAANNNVRVAQNTAPVNSQQAVNRPIQPAQANTKRYPGDDNPVNVHWGYYRYPESVPGYRPQGNNTNYSTVPANMGR